MFRPETNQEYNLRFKIAFTETNVRWLRGNNPINQKLIDSHLEEIRKAQTELDSLTRERFAY